MPINKNAKVDIDAVERIHGALTDFCAFLDSIAGNIDGDVFAVTEIPSRVTVLTSQKSEFDALSLSSNRIAEIMEKNMGYTDWSSQVSDFNSVFSEIASLRTTVLNNISMLDQSYNGNKYQLTVSGAVRTALLNQIAGITEHYN